MAIGIRVKLEVQALALTAFVLNNSRQSVFMGFEVHLPVCVCVCVCVCVMEKAREKRRTGESERARRVFRMGWTIVLVNLIRKNSYW